MGRRKRSDKRTRSVSPGTRRNVRPHLFEKVNLSDNARAILGDVYVGCSDYVQYLDAEQEQQSESLQVRKLIAC